MSDDPKRLLDDGSGASDAERALLRSAGDVEPAGEAQASMWVALATRLPPVGGAGAPPGAGNGGSGAGGAAAGGAMGAKAAMAGLIGAAIAIGAVVLIRSSGGLPPTTPSAPSAAVVVIPSPPPIEPAPAATEYVAAPSGNPAFAAPTTAAVAPGSVVPPASSGGLTATQRTRLTQGGAGAPSANGSAMSSADALRDEIALVAAARAALRRGDGTGALATLETARKQHPRGALVQEREVLTIEALAQSGDTAGASRRASAFLRAFPTSPHATHVRTFER